MSAQTLRNQIRNHVNPPPCQSESACPECSYAYSCHERRTGIGRGIPWGLVGLGILLVAGLVNWLI